MDPRIREDDREKSEGDRPAPLTFGHSCNPLFVFPDADPGSMNLLPKKALAAKKRPLAPRFREGDKKKSEEGREENEEGREENEGGN